MVNTRPEKFVALFNKKYPGVYRQISTRDVREMPKCGLIGRYDFYSRDDLELVRGLLQYEQMREKRFAQPTAEEKQELPKCNRCEQSLPLRPRDEKGRPREYCPECEPFRNRDRQQRLESRRKKQRNRFHPHENKSIPETILL